ncbi:hypothetical protein PAHAL_7G075300 [Panicum hallii]|uniref:non-specific serine/threonine protein kinase n=1 Tax=Panicum hallii TaxID=206008 RepID=A0A2S3I5A5_9POAL|nr:G-type lectin S-receptor-like serine/threonine-protein kinase LECRK4 isoform X2 [Panicum hallii]PAN37199.1 hypothetical protein PAHAL_7G075300 [Panicum hallii]
MALLLFPFLLLLSSPYAQAQQNITLGSSLTPEGPSSFWLSPSGDFAFGFRPTEGNTSSYLLAIWFNKISDKTVAWYAKTTDQDPSRVQVPSGSRLQLTSVGVLSLRDPTGTEVLTAPKMLRSRIMATDYSNGRFLLNLQIDGVSLHSVAMPTKNLYDSYWSTDGNTTNLVFDASGRIYITTDNGTQINLTSRGIGSMGNYYHRATLDPDGALRQYVYPKKVSNPQSQAWSVVGMEPQNICEAMADNGSGACGFNSYCMLNGTTNQSTCMCPAQYSFIDEERKYKGCKPDFQSQSCGSDEAAAIMQFQIISMDNVDWPLSDYETYTPITMDQCRQLCLTDCFCALAVFHDNDSTCWKKKMPLSNGMFDSSVTRTVLIKVPTNNSTQSEHVDSSKWKKDRKYWIIGSALFLGGSVMVIILLISVIIFGAYCTITINEVPNLQSPNNLGLPLKAFTYAELERATSGFQEVLGTGASGVVYKGQLQDDLGTYIAVKKTDRLEHETEKEFTVEVQTIGQTHHRNLVRLLGFCNEGKERLLVYEFMVNGSLNRFLFGDVRLQWNLRAQLALEVARGLLYLHEECSTQIIHCDIKPQNILLDGNFTAKISDFGLAKLLRTNQTQTNTGIRGTRGYVAPEWFKSIGITAKVDVYSYGVILLELICCRRNVESVVAEEDQKILTYWANDCYRCGRVDLLVEGDDEAIFDLKKVERYVVVALWCLQEDPTMRPTMLKVTQMLDGAVAIPTPPDSSSFVQ